MQVSAARLASSLGLATPKRCLDRSRRIREEILALNTLTVSMSADDLSLSIHCNFRCHLISLSSYAQFAVVFAS